MSKYKDNHSRGEVACVRLEELLTDMGWNEDWAAKQLFLEFGNQVDIGEKAFEQWFRRQRIPPEHIFNIAIALGVSSDWLGGASDEKKFEKTGLYGREVARHRRGGLRRPA